MRRRRLLTAGTVGLASAVAGCPADETGREDDRHPFADATVTVRVDVESDTEHDLEANAREALAFWDDHAARYAGFDVDFEVVEEATPDVAIAYVDTPERCSDVENYSERVLGCAPILRAGRRPRDTVTAVVVAGARPFGSIRVTTKHEICHILGLYHDDDPLEIMSNLPQHRIPMYGVRIEIWETVLEANERADDGTRLFNHGISSWNDGSYEAATAAFQAANDEYAASGGLIATATERTAAFEGQDLDETLDLEGLRANLDRLARRTAAAEGFTGLMVEASTAADAGETDRANERLGEANERIREFNDIGSPQLRDVAIALGLVRGYDRDEPVVDVDDEIPE